MTSLLAVALVLSSASPSFPAGVGIRSTDVRKLIQTNGARQALSILSDDDARWDSMLEEIATGRRDWLNVAAELHRVSDAHASETLAMAIQEALPKNPVAVLELLGGGAFSVRDACGMYGFGQIEDERPQPMLLRLVDKRTVAVSSVRTPGLRGVRDACLEQLKQLHEQLAK